MMNHLQTRLVPLIVTFALFVVWGCTPVPEQAERLIGEGKYEEARKLMEDKLMSDYQNPEFHYALGKAYLFLKDISNAKKSFNKALEFDASIAKKIGSAYYAAGQKWLKEGDLDTAKLYFASAVHRNPTLKDEIAQWAYDGWKESLTDPEQEEFYFNLVLSYFGIDTALEKLENEEQTAVENKEWSKALKIIERTIEILGESPDVPYYYLFWVDYAINAGKPAEEIFEKLEALAEKYPEVPEIPTARGKVYLAQDDYKNAKNAFQGALKMGDMYEARKGEAIGYLELNILRRGDRLFENVLADYPDDAGAEFYYHYARLKMKKNETTKALEFLKLAVQYDPEYKSKIRESEDFQKLQENEEFQELIKEEETASVAAEEGTTAGATE